MKQPSPSPAPSSMPPALPPAPSAPTPPRLRPSKAANAVEVRQWAFAQALLCKENLDIVADLIYKAAEIEAYITTGKNPRADFQSCVDTALAEVDYASIAHVSEASKRKVMEQVRKWLKEYHAL